MMKKTLSTILVASCSCTSTVSDIDLEPSRLEKLGVATGSKMGDQVKVFMVKDPDGNSIAFAQDQK